MLLHAEDTNNLCSIAKIGMCESKRYNNNLNHFAYKISDIVHEIKKRTTYVGSNRSTKEGRILIDNMSYSNDEFDLDIPLTKDAMANVFMPLAEFAEGVGESYLYNEQSTKHVVELNHGFVFSYTKTDSSDDTNILFNVTSNKTLGTAYYATVTFDLNYIHTDILGARTNKVVKVEKTFTTADLKNGTTSEYSFIIKPNYDADFVDNGLGAESVEIESYKNIVIRAYQYAPSKIKAGEWIELNVNGEVELYVCHTDCTTNNKFGCPNYYTYMPFDFRGTIHYIVWFPYLKNNGVLEALDTHIENALITYCMYRWFLKVNPEEAKIWYAEFERRMALIEELLESARGAYGERPMWYC